MPNPTSEKGLNVPAWLVGTWETNFGTKIEATENNIKLYTGSTIQDLGTIAKNTHLQETISATRYELSGHGSGYIFERITDGVRLYLNAGGMISYYDYY